MDSELFLRALMVADWVVITVSGGTLLSTYGLRLFSFHDLLRRVRRGYR